MGSGRLFGSSANGMGIVIVFPPGVASLFNPDVHRLVRDVEGRLENVFVTYALSGGAPPDVEGAIKAARFAGCTSVVVVHSEEWLADSGRIEPSSDTLSTDHGSPVGHREAVRRVVSAYNQAQAMAGVAA